MEAQVWALRGKLGNDAMAGLQAFVMMQADSGRMTCSR